MTVLIIGSADGLGDVTKTSRNKTRAIAVYFRVWSLKILRINSVVPPQLAMSVCG